MDDLKIYLCYIPASYRKFVYGSNLISSTDWLLEIIQCFFLVQNLLRTKMELKPHVLLNTSCHALTYTTYALEKKLSLC
jgi:hypothetical protein